MSDPLQFIDPEEGEFPELVDQDSEIAHTLVTSLASAFDDKPIPPITKARQVNDEKREFEWNPEAVRAKEFLEDKKNFMILGKAGVGKSALVRELQYENPGMAVVSPTGRASIIANGQTIHSFFQIRPGEVPNNVPNIIKRMKGEIRDVLKYLDTLIFDEISMVRADLLDVVDGILRGVRVKEAHLPFGGVQVVFVGDIFQLPPVLPKDEEKAFYQVYKTAYFFGSNVFQEMVSEKAVADGYNLNFLELMKVYRQVNDPGFVDILNKIRMGEITSQELYELNKNCTSRKPLEHALSLTSTRKGADVINQRHFELLESEPKTYFGRLSVSGKSPDLPAPMELILKPGARVMLCFNVNRSDGLVNGQLGTVLECKEKSVDVQFDHVSYPHSIESAKWEFSKIGLDPSSRQLTSLPTGTYEQIPLMLAWACTIHKGQGGTFDEIHLPMEDWMFSSGQAYVALSRTRTFEGLTFGQGLTRGNIKFDPLLKQFYETVMMR